MGYTNKKLFYRVSAIYFYLEIKRESAYKFLDQKTPLRIPSDSEFL